MVPVRDIEDAFKDESGRLLLSRTAVSELGERLWEDYQAFAQRDLSEYEIAISSSTGTAASRGQTRASAGGLGTHGRGPAGSAASHGGFKGGRGNGHGVL